MALPTEKNTRNIVYVNACICTCVYAYSADKWKELYVFLFIYWVLWIFKKC